MLVKIKRIEDGKLPQYKTSGSVGADCYARIEKNITILPGKNATIPLGFAVEIPDGYEMQIRGRSGLASKSEIEGFTGTIDSDYRGEVSAILFNHSGKDFIVKNGDRIAQAVISPISKAEWCLVEKLNETERGSNGFGSTGVSEEIKVDYPYKIQKFYEPFTKISEIRELLGKKVILDNRLEGKLIDVYFDNCIRVKFCFIRDNLQCGDTMVMNLISAFERVKIDNHRFGREIEYEE